MVFQHVWQSTTISPQGRRSPCGGQVHCQLTTARGLLDLHELTGEPRYLAPVLALHDYICRNTLSLAGGVGFYFNRPEENEACADADWLRLNLQLWRLTGETRYLDLAERTLVNQLPFAQAANGAFCYLRGLQNRSGAAFDVCCSHHAPRALWEALRYAVTTEPDLLSVNLFIDATVVLAVSDQEITLTSRPSIEDETLVLDVDLTLAVAGVVRDPRARARVGGRGGVGRSTGNQPSARSSRASSPSSGAWSDGDRLSVRFPHRVRVAARSSARGARAPRGRSGGSARSAGLLPERSPQPDGSAASRAAAARRERRRWDRRGGSRTGSKPPASRRTGRPALTMTPISATGGNPNGIGRSHPALASPFRVWIPVGGGRPWSLTTTDRSSTTMSGKPPLLRRSLSGLPPVAGRATGRLERALGLLVADALPRRPCLLARQRRLLQRRDDRRRCSAGSRRSGRLGCRRSRRTTPPAG